MSEPKKIYVASSWRNKYQPIVVKVLKEHGYEVYDFKDSKGFSWNDIDTEWLDWSSKEYITGICHPAADKEFNRDMNALKWCDVCIMVMPCGMSASLETGWAVGAGKKVSIYIPALREPDLMIKMADLITEDFSEIIEWLKFLKG